MRSKRQAKGRVQAERYVATLYDLPNRRGEPCVRPEIVMRPAVRFDIPALRLKLRIRTEMKIRAGRTQGSPLRLAGDGYGVKVRIRRRLTGNAGLNPASCAECNSAFRVWRSSKGFGYVGWEVTFYAQNLQDLVWVRLPVLFFWAVCERGRLNATRQTVGANLVFALNLSHRQTFSISSQP